MPDWTTRYETAVVLATALADPSISEPDWVNLTAFEPSRKFPAGHAGDQNPRQDDADQQFDEGVARGAIVDRALRHRSSPR